MSTILNLETTLLYFCLMFRSGESDSDAEDLEHADKLRQVKAVLEEVVCLNNFIFFCPFL